MHLNPKTPAALKVMVHGDEMVALPQNGWLALPLDETLWLIPVGTNWMESPTWLVMREGEKEKRLNCSTLPSRRGPETARRNNETRKNGNKPRRIK